MQAEHDSMIAGSNAEGYPDFSHTNIFGHITTYGNSAIKDPEIPVTQALLDARDIKKIRTALSAACTQRLRDS
jgi:hypothetical protein